MSLNNTRYGISPENLLRTLPEVLKNDENMLALAESVAPELAGLSQQTDRASIYVSIDKLPEDVLDALAADFKVDWWNGNYSLGEKRQTLVDSWKVHRRLGTPWAVLTAISAIYPGTTLQEWFDYGGEPYHFKLLIRLGKDDNDLVRQGQVLQRVEFYKNLRSVMDEIGYSFSVEMTSFDAMCVNEAVTEVFADIEGMPGEITFICYTAAVTNESVSEVIVDGEECEVDLVSLDIVTVEEPIIEVFIDDGTD